MRFPPDELRWRIGRMRFTYYLCEACLGAAGLHLFHLFRREVEAGCLIVRHGFCTYGARRKYVGLAGLDIHLGREGGRRSGRAQWDGNC